MLPQTKNLQITFLHVLFFRLTLFTLLQKSQNINEYTKTLNIFMCKLHGFKKKG